MAIKDSVVVFWREGLGPGRAVIAGDVVNSRVFHARNVAIDLRGAGVGAVTAIPSDVGDTFDEVVRWIRTLPGTSVAGVPDRVLKGAVALANGLAREEFLPDQELGV